MNSDIKRYLSLRDSLIQEKTKLELRLREINEALGGAAATPNREPVAAKAGARRSGSGRRGARGPISLRDAVLQATAGAPLTKEEILNRVKALGYRFSTNNPLNSLGVILYGKNPRFKNQDGRFSPTGGGSNQGAQKGQPAKTAGSQSVPKRMASAPSGRPTTNPQALVRTMLPSADA